MFCFNFHWFTLKGTTRRNSDFSYLSFSFVCKHTAQSTATLLLLNIEYLIEPKITHAQLKNWSTPPIHQQFITNASTMISVTITIYYNNYHYLGIVDYFHIEFPSTHKYQKKKPKNHRFSKINNVLWLRFV